MHSYSGNLHKKQTQILTTITNEYLPENDTCEYNDWVGKGYY